MTEYARPEYNGGREFDPTTRMLGRYALHGAVGEVEYVTTPVGRMPLTELSGLFYSQIAPLAYYADVPLATKGLVDVAVVSPHEIEVQGTPINLATRENRMLFAWNTLMALRDTAGVGQADSADMGMLLPYETSFGQHDWWRRGVVPLMERVNRAAGATLISATTRGGGQTTRYHVIPRLHLIDKRPADTRSHEYFAQALSSRLLALDDTQLLDIPYRPKAQHFAITTNRQVEQTRGSWTVNQNEISLINLLRLSAGQPLLISEIINSGFKADTSTTNRRTGALRWAINRLNAIVLNDGIGIDAIVIDDTNPHILRLTRSLSFEDQREMRTPMDPTGNDSSLRGQLRQVIQDYRALHAAPAPSYPNIKIPRPASEAHRVAAQQYAVDAFLQNAIGLRDMYLISLRLGMWFPFLRGSILPLPDGRRVAYTNFEIQLRSGSAMPLPLATRALGINPTFSARIFAQVMRNLDTFAAKQG